MQEINQNQLIDICGGVGCACLPNGIRFVALNEQACERTCCSTAALAWTTFENNAQPVRAIDLGIANIYGGACRPEQRQRRLSGEFIFPLK